MRGDVNLLNKLFVAVPYVRASLRQHNIITQVRLNISPLRTPYKRQRQGHVGVCTMKSKAQITPKGNSWKGNEVVKRWVPLRLTTIRSLHVGIIIVINTFVIAMHFLECCFINCMSYTSHLGDHKTMIDLMVWVFWGDTTNIM